MPYWIFQGAKQKIHFFWTGKWAGSNHLVVAGLTREIIFSLFSTSENLPYLCIALIEERKFKKVSL